MCQCCVSKQEGIRIEEKKYRLADFFDTFWEAYLQNNQEPLRPEQYKAVTAMRVCRTAVLGVDQYVCKSCGEIKEIYHSCRNRFCPTCSWGDTIKWAERLKSQMMDLPHRHVVFTVPHALIPLIKSNDKKILNILLRTSSDTFKDWAEHKHKIKLGIISVLHTFGETKDSHYHVHMIVSWGGIHLNTNALTPIKGDYVNYEHLQNKFRIKFENSLVALYDSENLQHKFSDRISLLSFLKRINKNNWVIHLEESMPTPTAVIRYIGRYSKRACLSERKIEEIDGEYISIRYKDYKTIGEDNKPVEKILRLHYNDFFPRLLQHVPLKYFQLVRYYGLYSNKSDIPEAYLNKDTEEEAPQGEWDNPFMCSYCQKEREYIHTVFDARPRKERKERFDINIHPSFVYKRA